MKKERWTMFILLFVGMAFVTLSWADSKEGEKASAISREAKDFVKDASLANGQRIYYYGTNLDGVRLPITGGPNWMYMHGGGCVSCHGEDGRGGQYPMMCGVRSEAITFNALTSPHEEAEGQESKEVKKKESKEAAGQEDTHFTIQTIRRAIEQGIDDEGDALNYCMPRWKISDQDFRDLIAYLMYLDTLKVPDTYKDPYFRQRGGPRGGMMGPRY